MTLYSTIKSSFSFYRLLFVVLSSIFIFSACSKDPVHRSAYVEFLKTEILAKQGFIALPELTEERKVSFGPYADSYQILLSFTNGMEDSVTESSAYMQEISAKITTPKDIMEQRESIAKARDYLAALPAEWDTLLAKAQADKAGLNLHEEVQPVYDEVFARYTDPVAKIKPVILSVVATLDSNLALADYLEANKDKIEFKGTMIIASDEAVHEKINELLATLSGKAQELYQLESELQQYVIIHKD